VVVRVALRTALHELSVVTMPRSRAHQSTHTQPPLPTHDRGSDGFLSKVSLLHVARQALHTTSSASQYVEFSDE
jgi:hypothetical protein